MRPPKKTYRTNNNNNKNNNNKFRNRNNNRSRNQPSQDLSEIVSEGEISGILDVNPKGFGFIRDPKRYYAETNEDPYVAPELVRKNNLKTGVFIEAEHGKGKNGKPVIKSISKANGVPLEELNQIPKFQELTTVSPDEKINLETPDGPLSMRIVNLVAPIGKGSRSLIVSPPKAGKTMLIQQLVQAVSINHPEIEVIALLIDERPEEVTDMTRSLKGEVMASSIDQNVSNHVRLTRLASEIVKRKVEMGRDVLVVLDSITRVSRAFNNYEGNSGRTMSGGLDSRAMEFPRSFFGAARNIEGGGSLTIIGTALIETGSRMDDLIFQEFVGTGNQEIYLDRKLADQRIWPAIDIVKSRTRREELLLTEDELEAVSRMRRGLTGLKPDESMDRLKETLSKYKSNEEFVHMLMNAKLGKK